MNKENFRVELETLANKGFNLIKSINEDLTIGVEVYDTYGGIIGAKVTLES